MLDLAQGGSATYQNHQIHNLESSQEKSPRVEKASTLGSDLKIVCVLSSSNEPVYNYRDISEGK